MSDIVNFREYINDYSRGQKDNRPWGTWEVLDAGPGYCVKVITVDPNGELSLQDHEHRDESWTIVAGEAVVTLGDNTFTAKAEQQIFIPKGVKHQLKNKGTETVRFVEVQMGQILKETDIKRYSDIYNRVG